MINDDAIRQKAELLHARGEIRVLFDLFMEQHARVQEVERGYRESLVRESRTAIERDEARAGRYQLALALGFDPDSMPLAQWMESAKPFDQPLAERCRYQERRFREAEAEWVDRFEKLSEEVKRLRTALERYGEHDTACPAGEHCTCGLRAALAG